MSTITPKDPLAAPVGLDELQTITPERLPAAEQSAAPRRMPADSSKPWHVLLATWAGGVFDGMDSSIFAMVLYPALSELLDTKSHAVVGLHGSYIIALFMVGWAAGSMIFGVLADYIGRARTLTITILLYALCTGLCATAHNWMELGFYRFLVGAGIGGELGIGAVLLSEYWPNRSRIYAISVMASSLGFGYMLTALLNLSLGHFGWRWLFLAGITPALLTVYIRSKLKEPESFRELVDKRKSLKAKAQHERTDEERKLLRFTLWELFNGSYLRKTTVAIIVTSVAIIPWWAVVAWIPAWVNQLTSSLAVEQRSYAMFAKDTGMILSGLIGCFLIKRLGYARCIGISFMMAFLLAVGMFLTVKSYSLTLLAWILFLGFFAHLPFVILYAYLPELFELKIRSTAFGFTYNIGRFAAAGAAVGSGALISHFGGSYALAAASVATIYLVGVVASFFMPAADSTA